MSAIAFGNILLSGACNLACPSCIGRIPGAVRMPSNLGRFPLAGLQQFCEAMARGKVRELSVTGTDTEPLLYRHHDELVAHLRAAIPGVRLSLHTNGVLVLRRPEVFHLYDRASISLPSLQPATCRAMTGSSAVLDLGAILSMARIPVKVSTLIAPENASEIESILARCRSLGVKRMVLRRLWQGGPDWAPRDARPLRWYAGNPVYDLEGLEVTVWDFRRTRLRCLNLYSDGSIHDEYEVGSTLVSESGSLVAGAMGKRSQHSRLHG